MYTSTKSFLTWVRLQVYVKPEETRDEWFQIDDIKRFREKNGLVEIQQTSGEWTLLDMSLRDFTNTLTTNN